MSERQEKARAALAVVPQRGVCCHCSKTYPARATSKYCSAACMNEARRVLVSVTCACGVVFQRRPTDMRKTARVFCSKRCATISSYVQQVVQGYEVRGRTPEALARNVQIVEMALSGMGPAQIAARMKTSSNIVNSTLVRTGVQRDKPPIIVAWRPEEDKIISDNQTKTAAALTEMLHGRTPKAVQARRNLLGRRGIIARRTNQNKNKGPLKKTTRAPSHIVGAFEPTMPKAPTITCETVVPTSYDLPDPRHQCTYLYGRALPYRQCQAVAVRVGDDGEPLPSGSWCLGHYKAVYRGPSAYERAA